MNVVLMPAYNGSKYIRDQIKSIISQLKPGDLLIISDDGSSDDTIKIIESFQSEFISLIKRNKSSRTYSEGYMYTTDNVNHLLSVCPKCDLIFFADQDDVWLPGKYDAFVNSRAGMSCILSDCSYVDQGLSVIEASKFASDKIRTFNAFFAIIKSPFLGASMAFDYNLLSYVYPVPSQVPHDLWVGIISSLYGELIVLKKSTLLYRRHGESLTFSKTYKKNSTSTKERSFMRKIKSRALFVFILLRRIFVHKINLL